MPFRLIGEFEALSSADLDLLQEAYDLAVSEIGALDDSAIHHAVESMISHYRLGVKDKNQLAEIALKELSLEAG